MRIVVDAGGGDYAPREPVAGAVRAARSSGDQIILVGRESEIRRELAGHQASDLDILVVDAPEIIEMTEHPALAVRRKRNSSVAVGLRLVRDGAADAFVSAGHSGATMAGALLILGRIPGIERPSLVSRFPTLQGFSLLLDVGANTDSKPEYLVQFAAMGSLYAERVLGWNNPRVGLLANGEEETKGDRLVQEAHQLLRGSRLNFVGNVEPKDMLVGGAADVVVADGFVGNLVLKQSEAVFKLMASAAASEIKQGVALRILGGLAPALLLAALPGRGKLRVLAAGALGGLALPAAVLALPLLTLKRRFDYRSYGGAPLLGVKGIAIIAHGKSDAVAIENAIHQARAGVAERLVEAIADVSARLGQDLPGGVAAAEGSVDERTSLS